MPIYNNNPQTINQPTTPTSKGSGLNFDAARQRAAQRAQVSQQVVKTPVQFPVSEPQISKTSFLDKLTGFLGGNIIGKGLGQAIALPSTSATIEQTQKEQGELQKRIIQQIEKARSEGRDTTRLQAALRNLTGASNETGAATEDLLNPNKITTKQVIGDALQLGTTVIGAGSLPGTAKAVAKAPTTLQAVAQGAKAGALTGGGYGAVTGFAQGLKEDKSIVQSLGQGAVGAGTGAALGGVLGGAISGATTTTSGYLAKRAANVAGEAVTEFAPNAQKIISKRVNELDKLEGSYKALRNYSAKNAESGLDIKKVLSETDLLQGSVDANGTVNAAEAISELNQFMKPQEDVISQTLAREGKRVDINTVRSTLIQNINDSGLKGGAKVRALKAVEDDIAGYSLEVADDGRIPLSVIHDAKVDKYANLNYANPESKRADKAIAKGLKQLVENNTESVDVKALNKELAEYYGLQGYLELLDGKKVEGGRLGKYFAQTVGAIVGGNFGPIGSIMGAEVAGKLKGASMASKFSQSIGKNLEKSANMESAIARNASEAKFIPGVTTQSKAIPTKLQYNGPVKQGMVKINNYQKLFPSYLSIDQLKRATKELEALQNQGKTIDMKSIDAIVKRIIKVDMKDIKPPKIKPRYRPY